MKHHVAQFRARRRGSRIVGTALLATVLFAGAVWAQGPVTLVFDNGLDGENLSGTLTEFDGQRFMLDSPIGLVAIPAEGVSCIGAACPEGTRLDVRSPVVRLTSHDGASSISGNLLDYVDDTYVLATDVGEIRIPAVRVLCEGDACVTPATAVAAAPGGRQATLTGNGMTIEGELLSAEDGTYVLDVIGFGELRVRIDSYACTGPGCP